MVLLLELLWLPYLPTNEKQESGGGNEKINNVLL